MPHRIVGAQRGSSFTFTLEDGVTQAEIEAYVGETIATALLAAGRRVLRYTVVDGLPRSIFCAAGACFDCVMEVDGVENVRTCSTEARPGMRVRVPQRLEPQLLSAEAKWGET